MSYEKSGDPEATAFLPKAGDDDSRNPSPPVFLTKLPKLVVLMGLLTISCLQFYSPSHFDSCLDTTYALCSPGAPKIYTVDGENTQVECFVVRDAHFVDTGSLGTVLFPSISLC